MKHLAQTISNELSNWWKIKNGQNKCDSMFHSNWINSGGKTVFFLYPCSRMDFSNGSIIFQGHRSYDSVLEVPSVRLVLNDEENKIDHAIVASPVEHDVLEEENILKKIVEMYDLTLRDVVMFARKLKLLNVSII